MWISSTVKLHINCFWGETQIQCSPSSPWEGALAHGNHELLVSPGPTWNWNLEIFQRTEFGNIHHQPSYEIQEPRKELSGRWDHKNSQPVSGTHLLVKNFKLAKWNRASSYYKGLGHISSTSSSVLKLWLYAIQNPARQISDVSNLPTSPILMIDCGSAFSFLYHFMEEQAKQNSILQKQPEFIWHA